MRKLLLPALVITAMIVACENKTPSGPDGVGPGGVTVSLTTTTTTTSTTTTTVPATTTVPPTTTSVVGSLSRRFVTFNAAPNVPSDMQLFYRLLSGGLAPSSVVGQLPFISDAIATLTEIRYKVTGTYVTPNGTTGTVDGDLFGPNDPIQNGGEFHGVLTATVGSCTAERVFRGPLGPQSMGLQGGEMIRDCAGSPLSFGSVNMTRSDSPPPPTSTTSILSCTFTVTPMTVSVPDTATTVSVTVTASAPTCTWTAQSASSWLTVNTPTGAGTGSVQFTAAANSNGPARSGTLLVAGQVVTVNQGAAAPADLVPILSDSYCTVSDSNVRFASVTTRNAGQGSAVVSSFTRLVFDTGGNPPVSDEVPPLSPTQEDLSIFALPSTCFGPADSSGTRTCAFTIAVDASNAVYEGATTSTGELNNTRRGACQTCTFYQCGGFTIRSVRNVR